MISTIRETLLSGKDFTLKSFELTLKTSTKTLFALDEGTDQSFGAKSSKEDSELSHSNREEDETDEKQKLSDKKRIQKLLMKQNNP
jgi:hypothetical protein